MLSSYRYACMSLFIHVAVLFLLTLTLRGTPDLYRVNFIFWGAILRPQEVSPAKDQSASVVELGSLDLTFDRGVHAGIWRKGLQVDKPDQSVIVLPRPDGDIPHFSGKHVEPDEANGSRPDVHLDEAPLDGAIKLRLEQR